MKHLYGKPNIANIKKNYFDENDSLLQTQIGLSNLYAKMPVREKCKMCGRKLDTSGYAYFISCNIEYFLCGNCGHIQGKYEETAEFEKESEKFAGAIYGNETREKYFARVDAIYMPKAKFIVDSIKSDKARPEEMRFLDVGCGSGYLVAAFNRMGIKSHGIDINRAQCEFANLFSGGGVRRWRARKKSQIMLKI